MTRRSFGSQPQYIIGGSGCIDNRDYYAGVSRGIKIANNTYTRSMERDHFVIQVRDRVIIDQLINTLKADVGGIKKLFLEENDDAFELYAVPQNETHEARMLILGRFLKLRKEQSMANVEMICCFEDSDILHGDNIREIL